jgi:hypothetical protein
MLSMLAQEEFAKVFLLFLVKQEIIPWDGDLLRAMNIVQASGRYFRGVCRSAVGNDTRAQEPS